MNNKINKNVFRIIALLFGVAGVYHLVGFINPNLVVQSPHWRHGLFIIINLIGVCLILTRPSWIVYPFLLMTIQVIFSHGTRALKWWNNNKIDWISLMVIVLMPIILSLIVYEQLNNKKNKKDKRQTETDRFNKGTP
jgi:hypothetical protein